MKKLLLFIFLSGILYGQAKNESPNPWVRAAISDSLDRIDDSLGVHLDTLQTLRTDLNTLQGDVEDIVSAANIDQVIQDSIKADVRFFSVSLTYPQSTENRGLFLAPFDMEITKVSAAIASDGGSNDSVKVNIRWGSTRSSASSELFYNGAWVGSTTGKNLTADIYDQYIDQNKWIWFVVTSKVGTITDLTLTVEYIKQ